MDAPPGPSSPSARTPSLGTAVGLWVVAGALTIGLRPLRDNSFLTHLATGRLILDRGSVPSIDPYTFTASGEPWVVQSWLASYLYASAEALGGATGLRLLMGLVAAGLVGVAWRLTRPAESVVVRLGIGVLFVGVGAGLWAERPLMLGLLALAAVVLAAEGGLDPRWMVPIGWFWVNTHGSFPLGLAYLVVVLLGRRLDGLGWVGPELRTLRWTALGVVAGAVGPLGPRVLVFPLELLQRQDVLSNVIEWRAPTFDAFSQRLFLVQLALAIVWLVRRPTYRSGLVLAVFAVAALLGARNLSVASLVLLPGMSAAAPTWGTLRTGARTALARLVAVAAVAAWALLIVVRLEQSPYELRGYPVDALAFLAEAEVDLHDTRLAGQDVVGNLLEVIYGPEGFVFYDDRFDMFPDAVSAAHLALVRAAPGVDEELARQGVTLVVWERGAAMGQRLVVDPRWRVLYTDERVVLACRRGLPVGGTIGTC